MSTRTQIYLTEAQRARLDELGKQEGKALAQLIREAVEQFLARKKPEAQAALDQTFGSAPRLSIPSRDEWERGGRLPR